jgi:hypothetical protein
MQIRDRDRFLPKCNRIIGGHEQNNTQDALYILEMGHKPMKNTRVFIAAGQAHEPEYAAVLTASGCAGDFCIQSVKKVK